VTYDLSIVCYSSDHILWCFLISIPMLIVWVIGTQVLTLLYLIKNRKRLKNSKVKKYFHILYLGYREEHFYWEFVNTLRKFCMISINVFLSQVSTSYKGMAAIITLIVLYRIQLFLKPYKLKVNNEVENASIVGIAFTIFGGLLFLKGKSEINFIEVFAFILIIAINVVYFLLWVYLLSKTYEKHQIGK